MSNFSNAIAICARCGSAALLRPLSFFPNCRVMAVLLVRLTPLLRLRPGVNLRLRSPFSSFSRRIHSSLSCRNSERPRILILSYGLFPIRRRLRPWFDIICSPYLFIPTLSTDTSCVEKGPLLPKTSFNNSQSAPTGTFFDFFPSGPLAVLSLPLLPKPFAGSFFFDNGDFSLSEQSLAPPVSYPFVVSTKAGFP